MINNDGDLSIGATRKFYLDSLGDTYITEYGANEIGFYTGGAVRLKLSGGNTYIASGSLLANSDNAQDLGSSTVRWRHIYTGDLNLSNEGSGGNEVDGTEGKWAIQEGETDLFLINRKSGKKYKFNITEIE